MTRASRSVDPTPGSSLPRVVLWLSVLLAGVLLVVAARHLTHTENDRLLLAFGAFAGLLWLVSRWWLQRRLAWLRAAMQRAGSGEPGVRLVVPDEPAWATIAEAFNATMETLERDRGLLLLREAELRQRNAALLSLREALDSHAIVSVTAINGDIVFVNEKFCRISGYTADELLGRNHRILKSGAHDQAFYRALWSTIRAGRAWHGVIENRRKDGGRYWVQSSILPVLDASGSPRQFISIRTDISSRERLRTGLEMLATAEQGSALFQRVAQGLSVGLDARWAGLSRLCVDGATLEVVACWDADAPGETFRYPVNGAPCELALAQDEFLVIDKDVRGQFPQALALASIAVESYRGLVVNDHDGRPVGVLWAMSERPAALDAGEAALFAIAAKRAAAELARLAVERELLDKESRLELVIEGADLGVWDWDLQTNRVHMNRRWSTMLGYAPDQIAAHIETWRQLIHPDDAGRAARALGRHFAGEVPAYSEELRLRGPDGRWHWVLDSGRVTSRDPSGQPLRMSGIHLDITERKRAEQALDAERSRLELVIRAGHIGFWDWDLASDAVEVNDTVRAEFGAVADGFRHMRQWFGLIHPDHLDAFRSSARDCVKGVSALLHHTARWRAERGWIWIRTQGQVTARDADGRALRMMGVHINIDELRNTEALARWQEERLQLVVEAAALGTWDWDMTSGDLQTNELAARMIGYEPSRLETQQQWAELIHPDDKASLRAATLAHLEGRAPFFASEVRVRHANGEWVWILTRGQIAQFDADGRAVRMVGIHLDINERKRAEADLIASEARFRVLVENVAFGIYLCDPQGRVVYANPLAERIFGMTASEANDTGWYARLHPDDFGGIVLRWEALRAGSAAHFDADFRVMRGPDDIRLVRGQAHAVKVDGLLKGFVGAVDDVTDRHLATLERDRLQSQLQQSQKMEALGQLTGGIAHDFNNILASILGYASLARSRYAGDNVKLAEYLAAVITAGERARDLIGKMLAFSRNTPREDGTSMDVATMVREVATLLASVIPSSITIGVDVQHDVPRVQLGATDLHQVLVNLAVNARDAMGEVGSIDISVAAVKRSREICTTCHELIDGDYVEIVCRDTGTGMDEELVKRIFEPFFTTKDVGKGTGMGLAVVHGIVHRAGGHILVESMPGVGTAFRMLLPPALAQIDDVPAAPVARAVTGATRTGRILVVDDEPMIGAFLRELLEDQGHVVTCATDGRAALALVQAAPDTFDLLITDQTMPRMSGVALVKALRDIRRDLPAVLCTGFSDTVDLRAARACGVRRFLRKPVESQTMLRVVAELLGDAPPAQLTARSLPSQ